MLPVICLLSGRFRSHQSHMIVFTSNFVKNNFCPVPLDVEKRVGAWYVMELVIGWNRTLLSELIPELCQL